MATTSNTPATDPLDVGTFIAQFPVGFMEPNNASARKIQAHAKALTEEIPPSMLKDLLVLKLLAPRESAELLICNVPMAAEFIKNLRTQLVRAYYYQKG